MSNFCVKFLSDQTKKSKSALKMSHKVLTSMPHEWVCHSSVVCDAKNDLFAFGLHSTKLHDTNLK